MPPVAAARATEAQSNFPTRVSRFINSHPKSCPYRASPAVPGRWRDSNRRTVGQGCQGRHGLGLPGSKGILPFRQDSTRRHALVSRVRGGKPLWRGRPRQVKQGF